MKKNTSKPSMKKYKGGGPKGDPKKENMPVPSKSVRYDYLQPKPKLLSNTARVIKNETRGEKAVVPDRGYGNIVPSEKETKNMNKGVQGSGPVNRIQIKKKGGTVKRKK